MMEGRTSKAMGIAVIIGITLLRACAVQHEPDTIEGQPTESRKLSPPPQGVYHGAFPDFGGPEDVVTRERIVDFQDLVGKRIVWAYFSDNWLDKVEFPKTEVETIHEEGVIPFIRMMPRSHFEQGTGPDPVYTMQGIIDGDFDQPLRQWARDAALRGIPLLVEFGTEVNGDWFSWSGICNGGGETERYGDSDVADGPERFRDAYRHIIDLFREEGAGDIITWVFHVNAGSWPEEPWNTMAAYYPGDDYIDWIGISVYGPHWPGEWETFTQVLDPAYSEFSAISTEKPLAVLEFGVVDDPELGDKATWIREALESIKSGRYPRIKAISYWHETWGKEGGTVSDLRLDSSPQALEAYRETIADPFFVGVAQVAHPRAPPEVVVLANAIDWELNQEALQSVFSVTHVGADQFEQRTSSNNIIVLGGPRAYEGVGSIVRTLLSEDEEDGLSTDDAKEALLREDLYSGDQSIVVVAGNDRYDTKATVDAHLELIYHLFASHPLTKPSLEGIESYANAYFEYSEEDLEKLKQFDIVVIDPYDVPDREFVWELKKSGVTVLAYIDVGEAEIYRQYWDDVDPSIILVPNPDWPGCYYADVNNPEWHNVLLDSEIPYLLSWGTFDGLCMDMLDTVDEFPELEPGMISLVSKIRERYQTLTLVPNRGFAVLSEISQYIDAVKYEEMSARYDFALKEYVLEEDDWEISVLLSVLEDRPMPVLVLDHVDTSPLDLQMARYCFERADDLSKTTGYKFVWYANSVEQDLPIWPFLPLRK